MGNLTTHQPTRDFLLDKFPLASSQPLVPFYRVVSRMGPDMTAGSPSASSLLLFSWSHTNLAFPVLLGYVAQPECLPCSTTGRGSTPRRPRSFSGSLPSLAVPVGLSGRHGSYSSHKKENLAESFGPLFPPRSFPAGPPSQTGTQ